MLGMTHLRSAVVRVPTLAVQQVIIRVKLALVQTILLTRFPWNRFALLPRPASDMVMTMLN